MSVEKLTPACRRAWQKLYKMYKRVWRCTELTQRQHFNKLRLVEHIHFGVHLWFTDSDLWLISFMALRLSQLENLWISKMLHRNYQKFYVINHHVSAEVVYRTKWTSQKDTHATHVVLFGRDCGRDPTAPAQFTRPAIGYMCHHSDKTRPKQA